MGDEASAAAHLLLRVVVARRPLAACRAVLKPRGRVVIVVNDRRDLYPAILDGAGLVLEQRYQRHVNRRTGRRAGEYFEDVLVARRS